jgi:MoaA/NifB/PqqE/SkfB family radical SAM enzyme
MTHYIPFNQLQTIIVDFTSHCNSSCGNCSRNIMGAELNPKMPLQHMSLETWKKLMSAETVSQLNEIIFNGAYGDALMNPNLIPALKHLLEVSDHRPVIRIDTNGGIHNPEYWVELAHVMKEFPEPTHVTFSVDGLEDTNHLYRRGVNFKKIMENAQAFIDAGGWARWRTLIFEHNKHQIEEMKKLSEDMGFLKFDVNGGSHTSAIRLVVSQAKEYFKESKRGPASQVEYAFLQHENKIKSQIKQYGSLEKLWAESNIKCVWQEKRKVQVSHMGEVWPCCYFLNDRYPKDPNSAFWKDIESVLLENEEHFNDVNYHSVNEILNHAWFREKLTDSWTGKRYEICPIHCSQ